MKEKWKSKRLLSILLMLCMVLTMVPTATMSAFAAEKPEIITKIELNNFNPEFTRACLKKIRNCLF